MIYTKFVTVATGPQAYLICTAGGALVGTIIGEFGNTMHHNKINWKKICKHVSKMDIVVFVGMLVTTILVIKPFYHTRSRLLEIIGIFIIVILANVYPIFRKKIHPNSLYPWV
ncbi:hypothetical protein N1495_01765 [Streptococcus didelphis]|uniref:hypothetical protein n=1 Tax=Streptococcus didelphis TaxID=102886 RepID=UPI0027D2FE3E|nr:hypothetical protein [Streptococcus didelphis]WMB29759.1 hypothetical protein N1495_01765 [Streptococcus didelphis]